MKYVVRRLRVKVAFKLSKEPENKMSQIYNEYREREPNPSIFLKECSCAQ